MPGHCLLGIDIGTTSLKSVLFDFAGAVIAQSSQEYPTSYPQPNWAQQNPDDWWRALCATTQEIFAQDGHDPADVAGLGVSCQAPSVVAVDAAGRPLAPALIWMDRRSEPQCDWLRATIGQETIARINGGRIDPYYMAPKLLWFKQHQPDLYAATHQVLQANGYIVHKLCGAFCMDSSHGPITQLFDSERGDWSEKLITECQLDVAKLPQIAPCTQIVGEVTREAASATGLAAGTPIVAGMTDGTAAGLEAGLVKSGDAVEMTGQSTVLLICSDQPYLGDELVPLGHADPARHLVVGALAASGGSLRWFRDELGEEERRRAAEADGDAFDLLSAAAAQSPPGANRLIFLPYMFGERSPIWDSDARGVFFGLSLVSTKGDLIRAIMEGAAFGLRHNVDAAAAAGFDLSTLACVGGGAKSALWNQIKADVLKRPVHLPATATGAPLGDATAAAVGVGVYPDLDAAVAAMVQPGDEYLPDAANARLYDELYAVYLDLYPALKQNFSKLAAVNDGR